MVNSHNLLPAQFAVVGDLPSFDFSVFANTILARVIEQLDQQPALPGVLIFSGAQLYGMVSRRRCYEQLGRLYGVDVFLQRPIRVLATRVNAPCDAIPADTPIARAVEIALARTQDQTYEPLVIDFADGALKLLDFHTLLLAQSQVMANANRLIRTQYEIGHALSQSLELQDVLQLILELLGDIVPYDRAAMVIERDGWLEFPALRGFSTPPEVFPARASRYYRTIQAQQTPLSGQGKDWLPEWENTRYLAPIRSWMGIPFIQNGEVIGLLSLARKNNQIFSDAERQQAGAFADQASVALRNARLYSEIKQLNAELEQRVVERTAALQAAFGKLQRLDQAKTGFIEVAAHELRTPITIMHGYSQMLCNDPVVRQNETQRTLVTGIQIGIKRLHEVVNKIVDVVRIDQKDVHLACDFMPIYPLLQKLVDDLRGPVIEREQEIILQNLRHLPAIYADQEALYKVFYNLMINAVKYTPDGGRITISGRQVQADRCPLNGAGVELVVQDTGVGIDPEVQELIFDRFYQTGRSLQHSSGTTKFKGGGPGLGLAIVRGLVEAHGGRTWVESARHDENSCPGSRFFVLLPVGERSNGHTAS